jgi:hypothetical protein
MAKKDPKQTGSVDIKLLTPIEVDGAKVTGLRMREPRVKDQLVSQEIKGSDAEKELAMMANLCEVSPDDLKQLTLRDYKQVQKVFLGFCD